VGPSSIWVAKMTGTHRQVWQDRCRSSRIYKVVEIPSMGMRQLFYLDMVSEFLVGRQRLSRFYKRLIYTTHPSRRACRGLPAVDFLR